jgi:hypothetical protein
MTKKEFSQNLIQLANVVLFTPKDESLNQRLFEEQDNRWDKLSLAREKALQISYQYTALKRTAERCQPLDPETDTILGLVLNRYEILDTMAKNRYRETLTTGKTGWVPPYL